MKNAGNKKQQVTITVTITVDHEDALDVHDRVEDLLQSVSADFSNCSGTYSSNWEELEFEND